MRSHSFKKWSTHPTRLLLTVYAVIEGRFGCRFSSGGVFIHNAMTWTVIRKHGVINLIVAKLRWNDKSAACCEVPDGINAVAMAEAVAETAELRRRW